MTLKFELDIKNNNGEKQINLNSMQAKMQNQIEFKNELKISLNVFFECFRPPEVTPALVPAVRWKDRKSHNTCLQ